MLAARQPVPAKEEEADKGGFQKERHQAFNRQRGAENIPDIMRVIGPVGTKLEFHGDAGSHPQREIDTEQLAPETGHVAVDFLLGNDIGGFHDDQNPHHAQS